MMTDVVCPNTLFSYSIVASLCDSTDPFKVFDTDGLWKIGSSFIGL